MTDERWTTWTEPLKVPTWWASTEWPYMSAAFWTGLAQAARNEFVEIDPSVLGEGETQP